jgi:hypothetical protein
MYPFVLLAPTLALFLRQAEPAEPTGAAEPAAAQEAPPAAPEPGLDGKTPPGAHRARPLADGAPDRPAATPPTQRSAEPERTQVARAALAFLDGLVAGDAARLAAASTERFSFDGEVRTGKEEIRRAWRSALDGRDAGQRAALLDLELLPAAEAISRMGPPPPRLASLVGAKGTWVAIANVSRRPVVLFLARDGNRWAVAGME